MRKLEAVSYFHVISSSPQDGGNILLFTYLRISILFHFASSLYTFARGAHACYALHLCTRDLVNPCLSPFPPILVALHQFSLIFPCCLYPSLSSPLLHMSSLFLPHFPLYPEPSLLASRCPAKSYQKITRMKNSTTILPKKL